MPISLVEVYQVMSDIARQAQESEAKAQDLAQQVQRAEAEIENLRELARKLEAECEKYRVQALAPLATPVIPKE